MGIPFELHPRLSADTFTLGRFPLCRILLVNDARYPWCILVPERGGITEIHQLPQEEQSYLIHESSYLAARMSELFSAHKMNIAALGNVVPQLHVHHVVRYEGDTAWPGPVWGVGEAVPYTEAERVELSDRLISALSDKIVV